MMQGLKNAARKTAEQVSNLFSRGTLQSADDSKKTQTVQIGLMADEVMSDIDHLHEYGFTSVADDGAEVVTGFLGGNRDHGTVIIIGDKRYRPIGLAKGEVMIYSKFGQKIHLKADGTIEMTASLVKINGDLHVTGYVRDGVRKMSEDRTIYNGHTHNETGTVTNTPNQSQ